MKITKKKLENLILKELNDLKEYKPGMKVRDPRTTFEKLKAALEVLTLPGRITRDIVKSLSKEEAKTFQKLVNDASDTLKNLQAEFTLPDELGAPVNMRMTGGLDASLEEIVKEEVEKILEQGVDPVVGKPVTLGGQRISREEAFKAFKAELSKMHDPKVVSRFMEALEDRLNGI